MKKIILFFVVVGMTAATVSAQKVKTGVDYENLRGPFITNHLWDNWFISAGIGFDAWVRPTTNVGDKSKGFNKVAPVFQLGVGKMLAPTYGIRLQGNYGKIKDYTAILGQYTNGSKDSKGRYNLKFNYWSIEADFLFHFSNAVGGYKAARCYNLMLLGGMGFMQSSGKDAVNVKSKNGEFAMNFGLLNTLRLSEGLDLYAELKATIVRQEFAGENTAQYVGASGVGMIPTISFGFIYKFKDRKFHKPESVDVRPFKSRIGDLEKDLAASQALADKYKNEALAAPDVIVEKITVSEEVPLAVFFPIGKAKISELEMLNVYYVAEVIKKNPQKVYDVIGIADRDTGTHEVNQKISEERAQNIYDVLVGKAGVNPDQLQIKASGDRVNPFELPEMNRVVIIE